MPDHSPKEKPAVIVEPTIPWEQLAGLAPPDQKALFEKLLTQGKFYFALTEALQKEGSSEAIENSWSLPQTLLGTPTLSKHPLNNPLPPKELSSLLGLPSTDALKDQAEQLSHWALAVAKLVSVQQKLNTFFNQLNKSALKQFNDKKGSCKDNSAIYSLWTECGESAFEALNKNKQYIESQTELLNILAELDSVRKKVIQELFQDSGLSNQQDLKAIYKNIHLLKRELRQERRQQTIEIETLKKEVNRLQKKAAPQRHSKK